MPWQSLPALNVKSTDIGNALLQGQRLKLAEDQNNLARDEFNLRKQAFEAEQKRRKALNDAMAQVYGGVPQNPDTPVQPPAADMNGLGAAAGSGVDPSYMPPGMEMPQTQTPVPGRTMNGLGQAYQGLPQTKSALPEPNAKALQVIAQYDPQSAKAIMDMNAAADGRAREATNRMARNVILALQPVKNAKPGMQEQAYQRARTVLGEVSDGKIKLPERYDPATVDSTLLEAKLLQGATDIGTLSAGQTAYNKLTGETVAQANPTPMSPIGKISEDAKNGFIPQDQADAAIAKLTQETGAKAGRFYAVQTDQGTILIDKMDGTAVRVGLNNDGDMVQLGQAFKPVWDTNNQPTGISQDFTPQTEPTPGQRGQAEQAGQTKPLLSPSIGPEAQAAKTTAVETAKMGVEKQKSWPKMKSTIADTRAERKLVIDSIDKAIDNAGFWTTGFIGNMGSYLPGTPQYDLAQTLGTIKANIGFDKLQEMRNNSPAGGALGQVSERENTLLQSTQGNIDQAQSQEQFVANLKRLRQELVNGMGRIEDAAKTDYGSLYDIGPREWGGGDIESMTLDQLDALDETKMSPEDLVKAAKRYNELTNGQ